MHTRDPTNLRSVPGARLNDFWRTPRNHVDATS